MTIAKALKTKLFAGLAALALFAGVVVSPVMAAEVVEQGTTEAEVTFSAGDLVLSDAPYINFGSSPISGTGQEITAESVTGSITVSDLRGANTGWQVFATLGSFNQGEGENAVGTLNGAYITVEDANVINVYETPNTAPTIPYVDGQLTLETGVAAKVFVAGNNAGQGVWQAEWEAEGTTLHVLPGTASVGTSTANISWDFTDAP